MNILKSMRAAIAAVKDPERDFTERIFLILTFIYSRMPATNLPSREVLPGSITATIGIMVASIAYLIYIRYFFRLDAIFGALTSIIVLILWFFMMSFMLVFGIIVNVAFRDTRAEK